MIGGMRESYDVIVLGGGAAGLMCAAQAGRRGRRVLVIDHADQPGKKILISGGGRCNFTNVHTAPDRFISANPHFAKSALSRYTPQDFLELVERYGIAWHEKTLGQLFCDGSARQIVEMLLTECVGAGVVVSSGESVTEVDRSGELFTVTTTRRMIEAQSLVIATGGPSIPKMGATGFAYELARRFGLKVVEPRPALVPLTLSGADALFQQLSGVATEVIARCDKASFREAALFTHRGLSGPAILQVSSYWRRGSAVGIDFVPNENSEWLLARKKQTPRATIRSVLRAVLPDRLADALADRIGLEGLLANLTDAQLRGAEAQLARWEFQPNGTEGFAKAEVTVGGVSTAELSSKTMEAKRVQGLFVIGEAVDVTGWLGGYNFQWAWASGKAAGEAA
jgi:predicted Rossmann fold flavoprotein